MGGSAGDLSSVSVKWLRRALLSWYDQNKRDLPWRRNADPYRIWVSEIMLQQTRVAAVLDHYARFLQRFPTVRKLAAAHESSVLAVWSGLGYYHRARRMRLAAKEIMRRRGGKFPQTAEEWRKLPGIGRYTAAAIASMAFGEPAAAVDGNLKRVLSRLSGHADGGLTTWQRAEALLDHKCPGDFNQAMMELGATICTPRSPKCLLCPLNRWCESRGATAFKPAGARKQKQLRYALVRRGRNVLLTRRPEDASLMAAMWELPALPEAQRNGCKPLARLRHSITDTDYTVLIFPAASDGLRNGERNTRWFSQKRWEQLPLTGLTRKVLSWVIESGMISNESN